MRYEPNRIESEPNPVYWVIIAAVFAGGLVLIASVLSSGVTRPPAMPPGSVAGDGSGVIWKGPGATVATPHATGLPDGPSVSVVDDVRQRLRRLPTDRNTPKGWSNPSSPG